MVLCDAKSSVSSTTSSPPPASTFGRAESSPGTGGVMKREM
jgi:hypothetical protein